MTALFRLTTIGIFCVGMQWIAGMATASSNVRGETVSFTSPRGVQEACVILNQMPGAIYFPEDERLERLYCSVDFYDTSVALCPKIWSTSPGIEVFNISVGPYANDPKGFKRHDCAKGLKAAREAKGYPINFKHTMNARNTSGTFSTASLLYYHFSRYFSSLIHVPAAVYRTVDKDVHLDQVTRPGLELTANRKPLRMNHAAWQVMETALKNPDSYQPTDELFTVDRKQIYGILSQPAGRRYGAEMNGTRKSGWGEGQSRDFQETAPFRALRSEKPLTAAIDEGLRAARKDPALNKDMGTNVSPEQMAFWMQELTEITLMDFIFSQQDRIGNIDYVEYWYWADGDELQRERAKGANPPPGAVGAVRLKRTHLNDNDAAGKVAYANFTKKTAMLEKIRHYNPKTYTRLIELDRDFQAKGPLYDYLKNTFGLSDRQFDQIVANTAQAANVLRTSCRAGRLRFDLDPAQFMLTTGRTERQVDCDRP